MPSDPEAAPPSHPFRLLLNVGAVGASHPQPWRRIRRKPDDAKLIEGSTFYLGDTLFRVVRVNSPRDMSVLPIAKLAEGREGAWLH